MSKKVIAICLAIIFILVICSTSKACEGPGYHKSLTLRAGVLPTNADNRDVTWSSSASSYDVYLQIEFDEEGQKILKEIYYDKIISVNDEKYLRYDPLEVISKTILSIVFFFPPSSLVS